MVDVALENVTKTFGRTVAVNSVSLKINHGELLCLLGPSGCGKTTTLRLIAGLEKPDSGDIYVGDMRVNDLPPERRDTAMVFQFYAVYPDMKVFDQIAFPLRVRKVPKDEVRRRVEEVARILEIDRILEAVPARLTMEQRQKIELGRAIVRQPSVYLFDEPLTNLDAKIRARMRAELKTLLRKLDTTTIYVTHDQLEAMAIADKIALMEAGKIAQHDTPETLYEYPKNLFVAGFIGSPPMNFIEGTVEEKDGKTLIDAGSFLYDAAEFGDEIRSRKTDSDVVLGIRPEHVLVGKGKKKGFLESKAEIVEPVGHRTIINLRIGKELLKANLLSVEVGDVKAGETLWLGWNKENLRIFDKKTGALII